MTDAKNVDNGGMGRRISEVGDLLTEMQIVDPRATRDFVDRLATENDWTRSHADRVYGEYLRFLLMAWMSPRMVVPSRDVDQAWHLHLTHTRHYWDVLCERILQKRLHHDPSLETDADVGRHVDHYGSTLRLYSFLFDEEAPLDIWPRPTNSVASPAVIASPAAVVVAATAIAGGMVASMTGHILAAAVSMVVGVIVLVTAAVTAATSPGTPRYATVSRTADRGKPRSGGGSRSTTETSRSTTDTGWDTLGAFTTWNDAMPAPAHGSHGHESHADGGNTTGGDAPGCSSCGGGGCGGGD